MLDDPADAAMPRIYDVWHRAWFCQRCGRVFFTLPPKPPSACRLGACSQPANCVTYCVMLVGFITSHSKKLTWMGGPMSFFMGPPIHMPLQLHARS